jgi:ribonuclease HI
MSAKRQATWGNESVSIVAESKRPEYRVRMSFDGGCRSNPTGHAAAGAVITDLEGRLLRHVGHWIDVGSNNVAEWTGLLVGLRAAFDLGATHVEVFGDSELVVKQFLGLYAIRNEKLRALAMQVAQVRRQFADVSMAWYRRENNTAADSICTAVLNGTYLADAETLEAAIGKAPTNNDGAAAGQGLPGEISVVFTCRITMNSAAVRAARERGVSDEHLSEQLAVDAERRLTMAGALGQIAIVPKRVRK